MIRAVFQRLANWRLRRRIAHHERRGEHHRRRSVFHLDRARELLARIKGDRR